MAWYKDGVQFECTGCGECCVRSDDGKKGYVYMGRKDLIRLAELLEKPVRYVVETYTLLENRRRVLKNTEDSSCVFYDVTTKKCKIYKARPWQCKSFPFWEENLESRQSWNRLKKHCEGVNQGPIVTLAEIRDLRRDPPL